MVTLHLSNLLSSFAVAWLISQNDKFTRLGKVILALAFIVVLATVRELEW